MSQSAATELRVLQDEHMAKQQAKSMQHIHEVDVPVVAKEADIYPQNVRKYDKTWLQSVRLQTSEGIDTSKGLARQS